MRPATLETGYVARSPLDNFLSALGGVTAVYSLGMGVNRPNLALGLAAAVLGTAVVGFGLKRVFEKTALAEMDGWLLALVGILTAFSTRAINEALGEEGLPFQLIAGTFLSFLIVFGMLVAWRDAASLFLSLPCVALFGLVGIFDAWRPAIALFFVFLLATAVLYARAFLRQMVVRAGKMGAEPHLLRRDVWKWVAGPEWAFASAAVVIVLSLMVGPLLQFTFSPVAGAVKLGGPSPTTPVATTSVPTDVRIGNGPVTLGNNPVFKFKGAGQYFRLKHYFSYTGEGWIGSGGRNDSSLHTATDDGAGGSRIDSSRPSPYEPISDPKSEPLEIVVKDPTLSSLPIPGVVTHISASPIDIGLINDRLEVSQLRLAQSVKLEVDLPLDEPKSKKASVPGPYPSRVVPPATARLIELADEAVRGASDDYERCRKIEEFVGKRCTYNTNVPAIRAGQDRVDAFLYETKEGYCDLFASSFVLLARAKNIQARYVVGYEVEPGREADPDGYKTVIEKDSHAWAEVYFPGAGWVHFDPTAFSTSVSREDQAAAAQRRGRLIDWGMVFAVVFGALAVAALVVFLRGYLAKLRALASPLTMLLREQNRFQLAVESLTGHPRRFSQSIVEFTDGAADKLKEAATPAAGLARDFETAFFSREVVVTEDHTRIRQQVSALMGLIDKVKKAR